MELMFSSEALGARGRGLTFDDVLLVPRHSEISSRSDTDLQTQVTRNFSINIPIISANMDTVTGVEMACAMARLGALGILHRFMEPVEQAEGVRQIKAYLSANKLTGPVAASIGVKEEGMRRADLLANEGVDILTVDIAHGDSIMMLEVLAYVKKKYPSIDVIAGNVASPDALGRLINCGADAVKVGIGPGSMCTTRIITGHGVPQLTAIGLCALEARKQGIPVIADGGIKTSGDMVKALCAGASTLMCGSLLAGTLETPGEVKSGQKHYRGMASKSAQESWRGELPKGMAAEGVDTMIFCKGPVENVILELTGGIRSGMTYLGAKNIQEMERNALFMEMTPAGMSESRPHGVRP